MSWIKDGTEQVVENMNKQRETDWKYALSWSEVHFRNPGGLYKNRSVTPSLMNNIKKSTLEY